MPSKNKETAPGKGLSVGGFAAASSSHLHPALKHRPFEEWSAGPCCCHWSYWTLVHSYWWKVLFQNFGCRKCFQSGNSFFIAKVSDPMPAQSAQIWTSTSRSATPSIVSSLLFSKLAKASLHECSSTPERCDKKCSWLHRSWIKWHWPQSLPQKDAKPETCRKTNGVRLETVLGVLVELHWQLAIFFIGRQNAPWASRHCRSGSRPAIIIDFCMKRDRHWNQICKLSVRCFLAFDDLT